MRDKSTQRKEKFKGILFPSVIKWGWQINADL